MIGKKVLGGTARFKIYKDLKLQEIVGYNYHLIPEWAGYNEEDIFSPP